MVGIVDEPILERARSIGSYAGSARDSIGDADELGIRNHAYALTKFISETQTPLTIGIQGEWGSGKTSLLNTIHRLLAADEVYKQIWINSWEHSLLSTPEEALLKITNEIVAEMLSTDVSHERQEKVKRIAKKIFSGALRIGATATLGVKGGQVADEVLTAGEREFSIRELRAELAALTSEIMNRDTNPFNKIVVYIDDLDRIEPKDAVQLLELLKNIFSVQGCIFVLAIDYQVVVKGLEHKFGARTPENEWEFRAFFDKIIQLPFMMPLGQYDIGNYVLDLLRQIKFSTGEELNQDQIREIVMCSIGGNPRSLKRLVNSLSLISIFSAIKTELSEDEEKRLSGPQLATRKLLLFTLVCTQIAYPEIYILLVQKPDFETWDEDWTFSITQQKEQDDERFERHFEVAQKTEDFDEDWERALYRICYPSPRYRAKAHEISKLLSLVKDDILVNEENKGGLISELLAQTSVTSVTSTDEPQPSRQPYQRVSYEGADAWINALKENDVPSSTITKAIFLADIFEGENVSKTFHQSSGCSIYVNGNKTAGISVTGGRKPRVNLDLMKDFSFEYKLPSFFDGTRFRHVRNFQLQKPSTIAYAAYMRLELDDLFPLDLHQKTITKLISRNIAIGANHPDKFYPYRTIRKNVAEEDQEAIEYALMTLSADYTYDMENLS
jgi:hypothetical protein